MKRYELVKLRKIVSQEIKRRERIKELLGNDLVKEYLEITKTLVNELDSNDIRGILSNILSSFEIKETNGIYVCTSACYVDYDICYEETYTYTKYTEIDSKLAESKIYTDIESGKSIVAVDSLKKPYDRLLFSNFENNNIVLNPYNTCKNNNGYAEVRMDFFETCLKDGQAKGKKLVLAKYPRI